MVSVARDADRPATQGARGASPVSTRGRWIRLGGLVAVIVLAFASPVLGALTQRATLPSEGRLTKLLVGAFGALSLPIVGAAVAAIVFSAGAPLRARIDRLVAAGATPVGAIARPVGIAIGTAAVGAGIVASIVDLVVRAHLGLAHGGVVIADALETAWGVGLGAAAWTALAIAIVARSGKGARAFFLIAFDLGSRLLPGAAAWLAPSMHVGNLLGAAPLAHTTPIPVVAQLTSIVALLAVTAAGSAVAVRTYEGAPPRR